MKTFNITIEEVISQSFDIEAETHEEAEKIAIQKYKNAELVLDNPTVTETNIEGEDGAWYTFY